MYVLVTVVYWAPLSMEFSRQEYCSGLLFPPRGNLPTEGSNPGLPHCRQTLYHLSHQESQSQRKAMPKSVETITQLHSSHMLAKYCSKFSKSGFNST